MERRKEKLSWMSGSDGCLDFIVCGLLYISCLFLSFFFFFYSSPLLSHSLCAAHLPCIFSFPHCLSPGKRKKKKHTQERKIISCLLFFPVSYISVYISFPLPFLRGSVSPLPPPPSPPSHPSPSPSPGQTGRDRDRDGKTRHNLPIPILSPSHFPSPPSLLMDPDSSGFSLASQVRFEFLLFLSAASAPVHIFSLTMLSLSLPLCTCHVIGESLSPSLLFSSLSNTFLPPPFPPSYSIIH